MSGFSNMYYAKTYRRAGITDSEAIALCMADARACDGERTVVFDGVDWHIDEAVLLSHDMTVVIDGCAIIQNDQVFDNVFRGDNHTVNPDEPFGNPVSVTATQNIRILGRGDAKIIGCGVNRRAYHPVLRETQDMTGDFWGWRTLQICLSRCEGFEIANISFERTRCWAMSFDMCSGGYVHDIHFDTHVKNGDGIDFRAGTHNCRVERVSGFTSDDTVACTALWTPDRRYPYKNYLYTLQPALSVRDGDTDGLAIHDISITDIHTGGHCHAVICLAANGLRVHDIHISRVDEMPAGNREAAVKLYTGYGDGYNDGDLHDIRVDGVISRISDHAVLSNAKMKNVSLRDIRQAKPGGARVSLAYTDGVTLSDAGE